MTLRYALIETNSGVVWWVGDAVDPTHACQMALRDIDPHGAPCNYEEVARLNGRDGFLVYRVAPWFDVEDGQDRAAIAAVQDCPLMATMVPAQVEEDA